MSQLDLFVVAAVVVGAAACGAPNASAPPPSTPATGAEQRAQGPAAMAGDVPLVVINRGHGKVTLVTVSVPKEARAQMDAVGPGGNPPLEPGESRQVATLKPGAYHLVFSTANNSSRGAVSFDLAGPTEVVVFENSDPPNDSPAAGFTRVVVESQEGVGHSAPSMPLACDAGIPKASEKPKPGPTHVDGHWRCVLAGDVVGTDRVDLVQLASGAITATVSGRHPNTSWTGVVAGDSLAFRVANAHSGGRLKIDPGGHALRGNAHVLDGKNCKTYTMTCTL